MPRVNLQAVEGHAEREAFRSLTDELLRCKRAISRLETKVSGGTTSAGSSGTTSVGDHGALTGLGDNDHPQYLLAASAITDHGALSGLGDDDHTQYVKDAGDTMTGGLILDITDVDTNPLVINGPDDDLGSWAYHIRCVDRDTSQTVFGVAFDGVPEIAPTTASTAPFSIGANSQDVLVNGLNADQVDGYEGAELAALAENETITGEWTFDDFGDSASGLAIEANHIPSGGPATYRLRGQNEVVVWTVDNPGATTAYGFSEMNVNITGTVPSPVDLTLTNANLVIGTLANKRLLGTDSTGKVVEAFTRSVKTGAYTILSTDSYVVGDTDTANTSITFTLPAASSTTSAPLFVKNLNTTENELEADRDLIVAAAGSDFIETNTGHPITGKATQLTLKPREAAFLISNGSDGWEVIVLANAAAVS